MAQKSTCMKKFLLFVLCGCFCTVAQARKVAVCAFFADDGQEVYADRCISLVITVADNRPCLMIRNRTDHPLYVDKGNSFAYENGTPVCLFSNSSYSVGTNTGGEASVNLGSVAGALGVGGVIGNALYGVQVGGNKSKGQSTTTYEQRILVLAPRAAYTLYEWDNWVSLLENIQDRIPRKKGRSWHYDSHSSILKIQGEIIYATDETFADRHQAGVQNYIRHVVYDRPRHIACQTVAPYKGKTMLLHEDYSEAGMVLKVLGPMFGGGLLIGGIAAACAG